MFLQPNYCHYTFSCISQFTTFLPVLFIEKSLSCFSIQLKSIVIAPALNLFLMMLDLFLVVLPQSGQLLLLLLPAGSQSETLETSRNFLWSRLRHTRKWETEKQLTVTLSFLFYPETLYLLQTRSFF